MDISNNTAYHYAVESVVVAFVAVVAVALERFYKDRKLVEAQNFEAALCPRYLFRWRCDEVFYWSVLTVLVSLAIRFLIGSAVHLHSTIEESHGPVRDFLWDILWLFVFGSFIVRAALAQTTREFSKWLISFSVAGILWSLIAILVSPCGALTYRLGRGWLAINGAQFIATFLLWRTSGEEPKPENRISRVRGMFALAFVFGVLFVFDVCHILEGSFWQCIQSVLHLRDSVTHAIPASRPTPGNAVWRFIVSGDSRNCGDVVMPTIAAQSIERYQPAFYWHLGDLRAIYKIDEDMAATAQKAGRHLSCESYHKSAGRTSSIIRLFPSERHVFIWALATTK